MKPKSTPKRQRSKAADRPNKPYKDFPLTPHPTGTWIKKIRGRVVYFGRWGRIRNGRMERLSDDGWKEALELYKAQADDLHAGRTPRLKGGGGLTLADLCNRFLTAKLRQRQTGEISDRTFAEYQQTTDLLVAQLGKQRLIDDLAADDFEALRATMAERWGPVRLGNEVQKIRTVFKYGFEAGLIDKPIRYGPQFKKPSAAVLRRHRAKNGERMIEAANLRRIIEAASALLKASILLGVNCGFGNTDVASLPRHAVDLKNGWVDFPRPKTGIPRRCPLWPETVAALRAAIDERPEPKAEKYRELLFITPRGNPWRVAEREVGGEDFHLKAHDFIGRQFSGLLKESNLHRPGLGFYTLRHVFRTVADECRDQVAVNLIMGHADPTMGAVYRERIDDARLVAVVEHVRKWLFGE